MLLTLIGLTDSFNAVADTASPPKVVDYWVGYYAVSNVCAPHTSTAGEACDICANIQVNLCENQGHYLEPDKPGGYRCDIKFHCTFGDYIDRTRYVGAQYKCPPGYKPYGATCEISVSGADLGGSGSDVSTCGSKCTKPMIGDPINLMSGNKFEVETDYLGHGIFPLDFVRTYNSSDSVVSSDIGAHWRHSYDRRIDSQYEGANGVLLARVIRQDGSFFYYTSSDGISWGSDTNVVANLTRVTDLNGVVTGWTLKTLNDQIETYDSQGRLTQIRNRSGWTQSLQYNGQGKLARISDGFGRALALDYDSLGRVFTLKDPAGQLIYYGYDSAGNLTSVKYQDSSTKIYKYNEQQYTSNTNLVNALTGVLDEAGYRLSTTIYRPDGLAIETFRGAGAEDYKITYENHSVVDPSGVSTIYNMVRAGSESRLSFINRGSTGPGCTLCSQGQAFNYDPSGFIKDFSDFNGNKTLISSNSRGLEETRVEGYGSPESRTTKTSWDAIYRLPRVIEEPGRKTLLDYYSNGDIKTVTILDVTTQAKRVTSYQYVLPGLVSVIDGPRTDVIDVTKIQYDSQGNVNQITDPMGHIIKITSYDPHGNPKVAIDASNNVETDFEYDYRQRLRMRKEAGATTLFDYYDNGTLRSVTSPVGVRIVFYYDDAQRLVDIADSANNKAHYTLDGFGNRISEEYYDRNGALTRIIKRTTDPATGRIQHLLGANGQDTKYEYYPDGQLKKATAIAATGNYTTSYYYDSLNRLTQIADAKVNSNSNNTYFTYDSFGNLKSVKDTANLTTSYDYDGIGNLTSINSPDTGLTVLTPDSAGNTILKTDARSITSRYSYDALDRLTNVNYSSSSENYSLFYDGKNYGSPSSYGVGRLTGAQDQSGSAEFYYNARGTLKSETHVVTGTTSTTKYDYDDADTLRSIGYPGGDNVTYKINEIGKVGQVDAVIGGVQRTLARDIQYIPFGSWTSMSLGNGIISNREFDHDYRVARITAGSLVDRVYSYGDKRDYIAAIADNVNSRSSQVFTYDELGELLTASGSYPNLSLSYYGSTYDRSSTGLLNRYSYDTASHHLLSRGVGTGNSFKYDAAGNEIGEGNKTRSFNSAGQLVATSDPDAPVYLYDTFNRRVRKDKSTGLIGSVVSSTFYDYDYTGKLIREHGSSEQQIVEYFYINGEPLALYTKPTSKLNSSAQVYYYHNDHRGAPQVLTDGAGSRAWSGSYDPFGKITLGINKIINNIGLPGQYYDDETGLFKNGSRDYDPSIGRYIESDPIGLAGGINTYAYVGGNPISKTDRLGLAPEFPIPGFPGLSLQQVVNYGAAQEAMSSPAVQQAQTQAALNTLRTDGPLVAAGLLAIPLIAAGIESAPAVCAAAPNIYRVGKLAAAIYRGTLGPLINGLPEETAATEAKAIQQIINNAAREATQVPTPTLPVPTQPFP